jgi:hypothetical protein
MNIVRICRPFKDPRNRYPEWRAGTTTLFDVPARYAGNRFLGSLTFTQSAESGSVLYTLPGQCVHTLADVNGRLL